MPGFSLLHFPTWNCPLVAGPSHGSAQTWRFSHYWGSQNKRLAVLWSLGRWSGEDQVENTGFWVRMEKSVFSFSTPPPSPPPMSLSQQMSPEEGLSPRQQQIKGQTPWIYTYVKALTLHLWVLTLWHSHHVSTQHSSSPKIGPGLCSMSTGCLEIACIHKTGVSLSFLRAEDGEIHLCDF